MIYQYENDKEKLEELKTKTLFIFDMDGTIYLEDKSLPYAINFITKIKNDVTKKYVYFTNNASKDPQTYIDKLKKIGFPTDIANTADTDKNAVLTSADVLIKFLKLHRKNKSVYLLGTPLLEDMLRNNGINLFFPEENIGYIQKNQPVPDIVVSSFDTSLTYSKLERACTYIRTGAEWLTTHPDINCPVEDGYIPDCGAINELIKSSTGKSLPKTFGKPYGEVVEMLEEIYKTDRKNMAMFGDRLYTDIALGKNNGMLAVLLLTGEASLEEALALPQELHPDLIFNNFEEIYSQIFI